MRYTRVFSRLITKFGNVYREITLSMGVNCRQGGHQCAEKYNATTFFPWKNYLEKINFIFLEFIFNKMRKLWSFARTKEVDTPSIPPGCLKRTHKKLTAKASFPF